MKRTISNLKKPKNKLSSLKKAKTRQSVIPVQSGVKKLVKAKPVKEAKISKSNEDKKSKLLDKQARTAEKLGTKGGVTSSKFLVSGPPKETVKPTPNLPSSYGKDRVVLMVRDPYWLHSYWEISDASHRRAEAALDQDWYGVKMVLRVLDATHDEAHRHAPELLVKEIEIQKHASNWYVEVSEAKSYRVELGYRARNGRYFLLGKSNSVLTPKPGMSDSLDENWGDVKSKMDKIYAMSGGFDKNSSSDELRKLFEERLRRPMSSQFVTSLGSGAFGSKSRKFFFQLDAELIVYGATEPNAKVLIQNQPVQLRPDGTFTMRFSLPEGRQILPAVAYSADGVDERTIVLAVERNTKALEPQTHEINDI